MPYLDGNRDLKEHSNVVRSASERAWVDLSTNSFLAYYQHRADESRLAEEL